MGKKKKRRKKMDAYNYGYGYGAKAICHEGNHLIVQVGDGGLYAGGWNRDAEYEDITIDLTGDTVPRIFKVVNYGRPLFKPLVKKVQNRVAWLSFPVKDFGVPEYTFSDWKMLVDIVIPEMKKGMNVLVACAGGHGRTGMAVAIMAQMIREELGHKQPDNPVSWLRGHYCKEVVETSSQEKYVYKILGLDIEVDASKYVKAVTKTTTTTVTNSYWRTCTQCKSYKSHSKTATEGGVCKDCEDKNKKDGTKVDYKPLELPLAKKPEELAEQEFTACPKCGKKDGYAATYDLCKECQEAYTKVYLQAVEDNVDPAKFLFDANNRCVVCGLERTTDANDIRASRCHGVSVGRCGHAVHDQRYTHEQSNCDVCYVATGEY